MSIRYKSGDQVKSKSYEAMVNYLTLNGIDYKESSYGITTASLDVCVEMGNSKTYIRRVVDDGYDYWCENGFYYKDWMLE